MTSMEKKTILKTLFSQISDDLVNELPLVSIITQNDKCIDHSLRSDCQIYLDLISKALVLFDINGNNLSSMDEWVIIADKLQLMTNKYELKRTNELMQKSLSNMKTKNRSFEDKLNEINRELKREEFFESTISEKIRFYSTKLKEYYTSVKTKESILSKIGFTANLRHESLEDIKQSNVELKKRLNDINTRLNEYKDFNPTDSDLRHKVIDMKTQINEYDNYFDNKM